MSRFPLGQVVATPGALLALKMSGQHATSLIARHVGGDWGEVNAEDRAANEAALRSGERLLSAYTLSSGEKIWVITEADRSSTTLLLPEDY